jgi:3-hydroxybutyryl-CoA dehydratase
MGFCHAAKFVLCKMIGHFWQPKADGMSEMGKGYFFEDLKVGMEASYVRRITDEDIRAFAAVSGDSNPIHLDEAFAAQSMFKGRIAHGILAASFISKVIGMQLPGPGSIYMSQSLNFRAPVRIGDEVTATVTVAELVPEKKRAVLTTHCSVAGKAVLEGEALVKVPSREA